VINCSTDLDCGERWTQPTFVASRRVTDAI
jgi:hypothetical protein